MESEPCKPLKAKQSVLAKNLRSHDFYEVSSGWPQEIGGLAFHRQASPGTFTDPFVVQEKRSIIHTQQQTSQQKRSLGFPPFHQNVLVQSFWDARDNSGRIKLLLSEQLIGKMNSSPGDWELGPRHDIVCFSFQHAPRGTSMLSSSYHRSTNTR